MTVTVVGCPACGADEFRSLQVVANAGKVAELALVVLVDGAINVGDCMIVQTKACRACGFMGLFRGDVQEKEAS